MDSACSITSSTRLLALPQLHTDLRSNSQDDYKEDQERYAAQARDWDERRQAEDDRWREIQEEKQRNYDEGERNIFHI